MVGLTFLGMRGRRTLPLSAGSADVFRIRAKVCNCKLLQRLSRQFDDGVGAQASASFRKQRTKKKLELCAWNLGTFFQLFLSD